MTRLLVASTNAGKVAELAPVLSRYGFDVVGLDAFAGVPTAPEEADSFAGNAREKALHYARATGLATLADDSGLAVDALGGAPGVRSARFAGPAADDAANNALLLERLAGVAGRRARFVCALCLVLGEEPVCEVQGTVTGRLLTAPRGRGGFGYDPLFVPDDPVAGGRTFAELGADEKRAVSHRGRAVAALLRWCDAHRAALSGAGDAAARGRGRAP